MTMSVDAHQQAEHFMAEADQLEAQGRQQQAQQARLQAAQCEARAFEHIPVSRPRTRGVIAVSAVALYRRAGALDEAIQHAHRYLGESDLPEFARQQLDELLTDVRRERQAKAAG